MKGTFFSTQRSNRDKTISKRELIFYRNFHPNHSWLNWSQKDMVAILLGQSSKKWVCSQDKHEGDILFFLFKIKSSHVHEFLLTLAAPKTKELKFNVTFNSINSKPKYFFNLIPDWYFQNIENISFLFYWVHHISLQKHN